LLGGPMSKKPLDEAAVLELQADLFAEDVDPPSPLPAWAEDQWIAFFESGGDAAAAEAELARKAAAAAGPPRYEVVHRACFVRAEPSVKAKPVGQQTRGTVFEASAVRDGWVKLSHNAPGFDAMSSSSPTGECWMLIDGSEVGLGELLRLRPPQLSAAALAAALAGRSDLVRFVAPVAYEVVVPSLVAHELPERESSPVGEHLESGARVLVQATCGGWLQLAPDYESQLLCGGAVAAAGWVEERAEGGRALRSLEKRLPSSTTYQVTRAGGPCFAWSSPGGAGEKRPLEALQYEARVAVEAECGHWVKLKGVPQPAWVELDVFLAG